jgi:DNA-binding GntR family transcriptional regulator
MATNESATRQQPPASKTEYVVEQLRRDIRSGAINPGEPLRQKEIAARGY